MQVPKRKKEELRRAGEERDSFMSAEAARALEADIARMERAVPRAAADLARAREMGDLSENAAYSEAKARLNGLHTRILILKDRLKNAVIVRKGAAADGSVRVGATVTVRVNGKERSYEITGSSESAPAEGKVSHISPIGKALLGKKAGDSVVVRGPAKDVTYEIVSVV